MKKYFFLLLILSACNGEQTTGRKNPEVPDLSAIVERQALLLDSLGAKGEKKIALNEKRDTIHNAEIDWQDELEIFKEADISDQRYASLYRKEQEDSATFVFRQVEQANEPVQFLRYSLEDGRISQIEAKVTTENILYERDLWMRLDFAEKNGHWLITSYRIVSSTDVLLAGRRDYSVNGEVLLENASKN